MTARNSSWVAGVERSEPPVFLDWGLTTFDPSHPKIKLSQSTSFDKALAFWWVGLLNHGALILATGGQPAACSDYLYGQDPRVLTQRELEQQIAAPRPAGPAHGELSAAGAHDGDHGRCDPGVFDATDHPNFTFGSLIRELNLSGDPSRVPLVPVIFNIDQPSEPLQFGDAHRDIHGYLDQ